MRLQLNNFPKTGRPTQLLTSARERVKLNVINSGCACVKSAYNDTAFKMREELLFAVVAKTPYVNITVPHLKLSLRTFGVVLYIWNSVQQNHPYMIYFFNYQIFQDKQKLTLKCTANYTFSE